MECFCEIILKTVYLSRTRCHLKKNVDGRTDGWTNDGQISITISHLEQFVPR